MISDIWTAPCSVDLVEASVALKFFRSSHILFDKGAPRWVQVMPIEQSLECTLFHKTRCRPLRVRFHSVSVFWCQPGMLFEGQGGLCGGESGVLLPLVLALSFETFWQYLAVLWLCLRPFILLGVVPAPALARLQAIGFPVSFLPLFCAWCLVLFTCSGYAPTWQGNTSIKGYHIIKPVERVFAGATGSEINGIYKFSSEPG